MLADHAAIELEPEITDLPNDQLRRAAIEALLTDPEARRELIKALKSTPPVKGDKAATRRTKKEK